MARWPPADAPMRPTRSRGDTKIGGGSLDVADGRLMFRSIAGAVVGVRPRNKLFLAGVISGVNIAGVRPREQVISDISRGVEDAEHRVAGVSRGQT